MNDVMKRMKPYLLITDIGFILYWAISLPTIFGVDLIPASWLFKDYHDPIVYAWNWSFFPLDLVLSTCGLMAFRRHKRGDRSWLPLAKFSLSLTFCAGFMAISFWTIRMDFDPAWWLPNLFLTIWPLYFLPKLAKVKIG